MSITITTRHDLAPGVLLFDLDGMPMTASRFESLLYPIGWAPKGPVFYPILANVSTEAELEIEYALERLRLAVWAAAWSKVDGFGTVRLVGKLDPSAQEALDDIMKFGASWGGEIAKRRPDVKATAWNNRLADLHRMRLLRATRVRRWVVYAVPWEQRLDNE